MLGWLLLTQLAVAFVGRSIGPLAPFIEDGFHLSKAQVGLLPAALFVGQSLVSIPAGWYADVLGTRKMLLLISVVLGVFFLIISFVTQFWVVLLCVLLGGLGYGAMHPTSNRGIIHWFPKNLAGTAMGIKQMGVTGGSALTALVLLPMALATDWRRAIAFSSILLLVFGLISFFFYRDKPVAQPAVSGHALSFWKAFRKLILHKPLVIVSLAAMGLTSVQLSLTTYLVLFVADALLYPLVIAGVFLSLSEISGSVGRVVWGIVSDRLFRGERTPVLILIAVITAFCGIGTALLPPQVSLWILVPLVVVFGFCIAGFNGIWMNFASESVSQNYAGVASGFSLSIGSIGVILGPPIFGWVVDVTGGYLFAWIFVSLQMVVVIGLLIWARCEMRKRARQKQADFDFGKQQTIRM